MIVTNGKLAILVPSRGRPQTFLRFLESFYKCMTPGLSDVILRNGLSDPLLVGYEVFESLPNVHRVVGTDEGFNSTWAGTAGYCPAQQDLYTRFPDYAAYLCIEDDTVLASVGFDRWLLDAFDDFEGRKGMVELYDRAQTIHVQCFSAEWCQALGYLCNPAIGEIAFLFARYLAGNNRFKSGKGHAEYTHIPLLRATDTERPGAMLQPKVTGEFYRQLDDYNKNWLPEHGPAERMKLEVR